MPGVLPVIEGKNNFNVTLLNPNGYDDEYNFDNSKSSVFVSPPVFDKKIIIVSKTNNVALAEFLSDKK